MLFKIMILLKTYFIVNIQKKMGRDRSRKEIWRCLSQLLNYVSFLIPLLPKNQE